MPKLNKIKLGTSNRPYTNEESLAILTKEYKKLQKKYIECITMIKVLECIIIKGGYSLVPNNMPGISLYKQINKNTKSWSGYSSLKSLVKYYTKKNFK